jgi:protein TonB
VAVLDAEARYAASVRAEIVANRQYPRRALRRRLEGVVIVGFRIQADGRIDSVRVINSSGHDVLDAAAVEAVRKSRKFDAFPDEIDKPDWEFDVRVSFRVS